MKPKRRRTFLPGEAALVGVDFLEIRQLLSVTGKAAEVAQAAATPAIAASATDNPSPVAADATGARTVGASASQPARVVPSAAADSAGNPKGSDAEEFVSHAGTTAARSGASSLVVAGAGAASAEQSPADESATGSAPDAPAGDPASDVASPIGAGVVPVAAPSDLSAASPPASMPARSGPSMGGVAGSFPVSNGPTEAEVGVDGALLTIGAGSTATGVVRVSYSRIRPTIDAHLVGPQSPPSGGRVATEPVASEEPWPLPRAADLLTEFLPFDRARLEDAIDGFLAPLESMGTELAAWSSPWKLIPAATMVVGAAVATEVARRRIQSHRDSDDEGPEDLAWSPGYPSGWKAW